MKESKSELVKQQLTEKFLNCLDEKQEDWIKGWRGGLLACNGISNRNYSGMNRFILSYYSQENKFEGNRFYTFNQIRDKGYHLENAKGKGIPVMYPMFLYYQDANTDRPKYIGVGQKQEMIRSGEATEGDFKWASPMVKYVFSEDLIPEIEKDPNQHMFSEDEKLNYLKDFMKETGVDFYQSKINGRCYYRPDKHRIVMPPDNHFYSKEAMIATLAHEIAHSTGKAMERDLSGEFGSESYAKEELRAEMASAYICAELGVDSSLNENSNIAYIQSWSKAIKENRTYLEEAVKDADKICNYVTKTVELHRSKDINKDISKHISKDAPKKDNPIEL